MSRPRNRVLGWALLIGYVRAWAAPDFFPGGAKGGGARGRACGAAISHGRAFDGYISYHIITGGGGADMGGGKTRARGAAAPAIEPPLCTRALLVAIPPYCTSLKRGGCRPTPPPKSATASRDLYTMQGCSV